jgi:hypothetical protein
MVARKLKPKAPEPKITPKAVTAPPKGPLTPIEMPSAGKDYTDILIWVFDAGERVYHLDHRRNLKTAKLDGQVYEMNGHKYTLILDRAFRIKWAPWKKLILAKPYATNLYRFINEIMRSKKIGIIYYQEPCTHKHSSCVLLKTDPDCCKKIPDMVEPMHISRIHQPSGRMMG